MICENAYYLESEKKPRCKNIKDDNNSFGNKCPLIYFCPITDQYENTSAMFKCVYREGKNGK